MQIYLYQPDLIHFPFTNILNAISISFAYLIASAIDLHFLGVMQYPQRVLHITVHSFICLYLRFIRLTFPKKISISRLHCHSNINFTFNHFRALFTQRQLTSVSINIRVYNNKICFRIANSAPMISFYYLDAFVQLLSCHSIFSVFHISLILLVFNVIYAICLISGKIKTGLTPCFRYFSQAAFRTSSSCRSLKEI